MVFINLVQAFVVWWVGAQQIDTEILNQTFNYSSLIMTKLCIMSQIQRQGKGCKQEVSSVCCEFCKLFARIVHFPKLFKYLFKIVF
jgi:hypothetical protein